MGHPCAHINMDYSMEKKFARKKLLQKFSSKMIKLKYSVLRTLSTAKGKNLKK